MNFYTLTFKNKIFLSFSLVFLLIIILDIALIFVADLKTTEDLFINEKNSKLKHFSLNNTLKKDIIFIGSSRTFFHISTNLFKNKNIDVYNLGVSGSNFEDYPTLIQGVVQSKPEKIVISLSVNQLYSQLTTSDFPTIEELKNYYDIDKIKFMKSLYTWLINYHTLLIYSEPMHYKLQANYDRFTPKINTPTQDLTKRNIEKKLPSINNATHYSELVGCNVFDIKNIADTKVSLKCENGDGILIANNIRNEQNEQITLGNLDNDSIKYLSKMIAPIKTNGIDVIIILEPIFHNKYIYNLEKIKKNLEGIKIIDLTNFIIEDKMWSDNNHLNYLGREEYSLYLTQIIKQERNDLKKPDKM